MKKINKIKNKVTNKYRKIVTLFLALLLGLSGTTSIMASSHNVTQTFYSEYNAVTGNGGVYGNYAALRIDGQVAWCLQANRVAQTGVNNAISFEDIGINRNQQEDLSLIANFGYHVSPSRENEVLTQNAVWTYLGWTDWYPTPNYPTRDAFNNWYNNILNQVQRYKLGASFHNQSFEINVGQTITINDSNGVLSDMHIVSTDGLQVSINGNQLSVTGTINASDTSTVILRKPVSNEGTNFVVRNGNSQALSVLNLGDPNRAVLQFKVNKYVDVNLSKVDSELGTFASQGDATLIGAEYTLYNSNNQAIETKAFGQNGIIRFEKLWANDTYYIRETKAPTGYLLSDEVFHINPAQLLSSGQVGTDLQLHLTAKEDVMKQAFSIIKVSSDGTSTELPTLQGEEFTVKLQSEVDRVGWDNAKTYDTLITGENGEATSIRLPYGTYLVRQTYTLPDVQTTRDFTVVIDQDSDTPQFYRILNNAPFKAYIRLIKRDAITGENIILNSASFQIHDHEGNPLSQKVGDQYIDTFTTDETGTITTPLMIEAGTYFIYEVVTPNGYLTLAEPIEVVITNQGAVQIDQDGDPIIEIVVENEKPTGKIIIEKSFEEFENVDSTVDEESDDIDVEATEIENIEVEEIEETSLFAKFKVVVAEDIINPVDGSLLHAKGDVISNLDSEDGLWSTNENMQIKIDNLPLGTGQASFIIYEVDATENYVLADPILVTFTQDDNTTKEYVIELDIENELTETVVSKVDAETKEALENANLEIRALDGDIPYVLNDIELRHISTEGYWIIKGLPRDIQFVLHESEAPEGYYIADDLFFIGGQEGLVILENEPILTSILVNKVDRQTNEPIIHKDFMFGIFADPECTELIAEVSANTEDGTAIFENLRFGTYYVKEISAPAGYQLSDEVKEVIIKADLDGIGDVHSFVYFNILLPGGSKVIIDTGDTTGIALLITAVAVSLGGMFVFRKKKENKDV